MIAYDNKEVSLKFKMFYLNLFLFYTDYLHGSSKINLNCNSKTFL